MTSFLFVLMVLGVLSPPVFAQVYSTSFSLTENPITEGGGRWLNGEATGLVWEDVQTASGNAFGTDDDFDGYDDSAAILTGTWGANQAVEATVFCENAAPAASEEVEIRLRSALSANVNTGYEVLFSCAVSGGAYSQIVRWNGALGDFTVLNHTGPGATVDPGDVVYAEIVGTTITAKVNGSMVMTVSDSTYSSGNPGIGFFQRSDLAHNALFGFTQMTATSPPGAVPAPPTGLIISGLLLRGVKLP